jgi:hypothetical protein
MPSLSRTRSWPAGEIACVSRQAAHNTQSSNVEDQIQQSDRPSTWLRAPAPARFVRKQNKPGAKEQPRSSNDSSEIVKLGSDSSTSATVEIDAEVWTFANNRNSTGRAHALSTQSKYYLAHRQHVAGELTKADAVATTQGESCDELWDGFLRVLSV